MWVYSADHAQVFGPYQGAAPAIAASSGAIPCSATLWWWNISQAQPVDFPPFSIGKVAQLLPVDQVFAAGSCELDVACYPAWSGQASGTGMYLFQQGSYMYACSGGLINNSKMDSKPYFLTANHCISSAATASTVEVFWLFQSASCNGAVPALSSVPRTLGATYLASAAIPNGDYSLLQLSSLPNINLVFYGWNASATALPVGTAVTGIHHPQADYTRIVFGVRNADAAAQVGTDLAPASMFYQIQATSGRIEPGSSGSPLFTQDKLLVGALTYGPGGDACSTSPFTAGYGRFSVAYPALSSYLSPPTGSTSAVTVTAAPTSIKAPWTIGGAAPATQTIQVTTSSSTAVSLTLKANQPWITLSASTLSVTAAKPGSFVVTLGVQTFNSASTNTGSITITGSGISQTLAVEVDVTAPASAVKGGPVSVIPLVFDGAGVSTSLILLNPYASATNASVSFALGSGAALPMPFAGAAAAAWQNVTIPAFGAATVTTAGTSSPQKLGLAVVQSSDATKRVQPVAQVGQDLIPPSVIAALPLAMQFDATGTYTTSLYLYNPGNTALSASFTVYDSGGAVIGSGAVSLAPQQQSYILTSKSATVVGGKKGTIYVTGTGAVLAMGIRTGSDGRMEALIPEVVTH